MFERFTRSTFLLLGVAAATLGATGCKPKDTSRTDAIESCTDQLKATAEYPTTAEIPFPNKHEVTTFTQQLEWTHGGGLRFMNSKGAKLDASAICTTSTSGILVERLSVNGYIVWDLKRDLMSKVPATLSNAHDQ